MTRVLAFDFGASSGRAICASFEDGKLSHEEIHRFENVPITQNGHLHWDFDKLLQEVHIGIKKAGKFSSIGFDTWGVDFGLLNEEGKLLELPVHYRDERTQNILPTAFNHMPEDSIYKSTGNQIMHINTLFQLLALQKQEAKLWQNAKTLLFMPDLFAYALCGKIACERTIASTSQMLNSATGGWAQDVLKTFEIPQSLFAPIVQSGTVIGKYNGANVVAVAGHDTQCAVAALPTNAPNIAFLSCGTWSLLGCELDDPLLTNKALSNEIGANGKINYLSNIIGLWLIQESRREWRRQGTEYSYAQLESLALDAKPFQSFINPDDSIFTPPGDIPARVMAFCCKTKQTVPATVGEVMRCIYESLALKYHHTLKQLEKLTSKKFTALHVLGGGAKDKLLCQMSANACAKPVVAGPIEATALGNIIIQLIAQGQLENIADGRTLIAKTELLKHYTPQEKNQWETAYKQYKKILNEGEDK